MEEIDFIKSFLTFLFLVAITFAMLIWGVQSERKRIDKDEEAIHLILENKIPRINVD